MLDNLPDAGSLVTSVPAVYVCDMFQDLLYYYSYASVFLSALLAMFGYPSYMTSCSHKYIVSATESSVRGKYV